MLRNDGLHVCLSVRFGLVSPELKVLKTSYLMEKSSLVRVTSTFSDRNVKCHGHSTVGHTAPLNFRIGCQQGSSLNTYLQQQLLLR